MQNATIGVPTQKRLVDNVFATAGTRAAKVVETIIHPKVAVTVSADRLYWPWSGQGAPVFLRISMTGDRARR
jgi:hypothetical protein